AAELEAIDAEIIKFLQANSGEHGRAAIEAGTGDKGIGARLKGLVDGGKIKQVGERRNAVYSKI
ncbi:MAG: hypothetical protein HGA82_00085, partial [Anaerolineales bacterium]|nr:hypothetical protein [Anaerolineales bacterium]